MSYHPIRRQITCRGFYLRNPNWEFNCPIVDDNILSMTLLGTRLAADILPEPLRSDIDQAVGKSLANNNSEFFDDAMIESLLCATGIKAAVDPVVFKKVFDGWRLHQVLGEGGHIEVLDPPELRAKIAEAARKILERNA